MEGYNSTLTGSQIEERLQLVPKNSQNIALLQEAIKAFVSSEQMQAAITNALTDYYTKDESNKLLATKQTAEQVSAAITAALPELNFQRYIFFELNSIIDLGLFLTTS